MNIQKILSMTVRFIFCFIGGFINNTSMCNNELNFLKQELERKEVDALYNVAKFYGLSSEQYQRFLDIITQEKELVFNDIGSYNPKKFESVQHLSGFPVDVAEKVCKRNGIDYRNVILWHQEGSYANNTTGDAKAFATASYEMRDISVNKDGKYQYSSECVHKPRIDIYPSFHLLSDDQKQAMLIHEIEHIKRLHSFKKAVMKCAINRPNNDFYASSAIRQYRKAEENSANIIPAIENAEVAQLLAGICQSDKRRIFSNEDCQLLRKINTLHQNKN